MISRTPEICTVCNGHSHRDYAMAENCLSPVRLCNPCRAIYRNAFGENAIIPFLGGPA